MRHIVAIVGMTGSGKTDAAEIFKREGFEYARFGQVVLDEVKRLGIEPTEENEKLIRENMRAQHGMGAMAIFIKPYIDKAKGNIILDGLYSWAEYKILKDTYQDMIVLAIHASPDTRYSRLKNRVLENGDVDLKRRPASKEQAKARDYAEIENIEKGGPISMADYMIINEGSPQDLETEVIRFINNLS